MIMLKTTVLVLLLCGASCSDNWQELKSDIVQEVISAVEGRLLEQEGMLHFALNDIKTLKAAEKECACKEEMVKLEQDLDALTMDYSHIQQSIIALEYLTGLNDLSKIEDDDSDMYRRLFKSINEKRNAAE